MSGLRKIGAGESLDAFASYLAHEMFQGITRDSGLPYTSEHLAEVARLADIILLPSPYKAPAVAAAWLHDSAEDIKGFDVFNPFGPGRKKARGVMYLNDLLREAGEAGKHVCFMVDLLTHRKGISYQDYVMRIFTFPESGVQRTLGILAAVVKMADRRMNINPDEHANFNRLVEEYLGMDGQSRQQLEDFYRRTKTIDAFVKRGDRQINVALFVETLQDTFKARQEATAIDNLCLCLPLAEQKLLVQVGEQNSMFGWERLRSMLKDTYVQSLRLYPGVDAIHVAKRLGANRKAPEVPGYVPILDELRREAYASTGKKSGAGV